MERMSGFHGNRQHANYSSSGLNMTLANETNTNNPIINSSSGGGGGGGGGSSSGGGERAHNACVIREQDQYMPIANVIRIMRRILPSHAKISDDAKETIQECVSEYISFITGEANDRCQREQRKTVTAEDVLWAMAKLGFDDYVEPLTLFLNRYRESENDRANLGRPEPFLRRGVGTISINSSSNNSNSTSTSTTTSIGIMEYGGGLPNAGLNSFGGVGPYGPPGFNLGPGPYPGPGLFDSMGQYFQDGSNADASAGAGAGGSASHNLFGGYDPFGQFK